MPQCRILECHKERTCWWRLHKNWRRVCNIKTHLSHLCYDHIKLSHLRKPHSKRCFVRTKLNQNSVQSIQVNAHPQPLPQITRLTKLLQKHKCFGQQSKKNRPLRLLSLWPQSKTDSPGLGEWDFGLEFRAKVIWVLVWKVIKSTSLFESLTWAEEFLRPEPWLTKLRGRSVRTWSYPFTREAGCHALQMRFNTSASAPSSKTFTSKFKLSGQFCLELETVCFLSYLQHPFCTTYHCSPTGTEPIFRPRRAAAEPERAKRPGEKWRRSTQLAAPSKISSDMANPLTGAHRMPQQLCPAEIYAPRTCGTLPIIGKASGGHGRIHAWTISGSPPSLWLISEKHAVAAFTRAGSGFTSDGGNSPRRSWEPSTYSEPPIPQMYTSPELRG